MFVRKKTRKDQFSVCIEQKSLIKLLLDFEFTLWSYHRDSIIIRWLTRGSGIKCSTMT